MYRDLLVHVDGSDAGRRRVRFAVELAVRFEAQLSGLHVTPPAEVPYRYKPSRVAEVVVNVSRRLVLEARNAAKAFREEAQRRLPDALWLEISGDVAQGISDRARYADLVILGQYERQGAVETHPLPIAHSVVLRCGRPVLVVPATVESKPLGRAVLAWDGSREAVRAVHDAMPLLRLSSSIQIVKIIDAPTEEEDADTKCLSEHLAQHGLKVATDVIRVTTEAEHETLRTQIERGRYDLLVMGGYSHPKWLEFIFGGATESILLSSKIPVLVSH